MDTAPKSFDQLLSQIYTVGRHTNNPALRRWSEGAVRFLLRTGEQMNSSAQNVQTLINAMDNQLTAAKARAEKAEAQLTQPYVLDNETLALMESVAKKHGVNITLLPAAGKVLDTEAEARQSG